MKSTIGDPFLPPRRLRFAACRRGGARRWPNHRVGRGGAPPCCSLSGRRPSATSRRLHAEFARPAELPGPVAAPARARPADVGRFHVKRTRGGRSAGTGCLTCARAELRPAEPAGSNERRASSIAPYRGAVGILGAQTPWSCRVDPAIAGELRNDRLEPGSRSGRRRSGCAHPVNRPALRRRWRRGPRSRPRHRRRLDDGAGPRGWPRLGLPRRAGHRRTADAAARADRVHRPPRRRRRVGDRPRLRARPLSRDRGHGRDPRGHRGPPDGHAVPGVARRSGRRRPESRGSCAPRSWRRSSRQLAAPPALAFARRTRVEEAERVDW